MKSFSLTILGSNSALPTSKRYPTAQILNVSEHFFLIDCGEGTQMQLRRNHAKFMKINNIFISHLHGDHCFGLIGLISTFGLMGRKHDLNIYSHPDLEKLLTPQLDYFCKELPFKIVFHAFDASKNNVIFENKHITVSTIPLKHRIPTAGFLFKEKLGERKIKKDFVFVHNPSIKEMLQIKKGFDFIDEDGNVLANKDITLPPPKPRSYAFCSDTKYTETIINQIKEVDLLYHEATFLEDNTYLAKKTYHSTAKQAAVIAKKANVKKLIIGHFSSRYHDVKPFLYEAKVEFSMTELAVEGSVFNVD